MDFLAVGDTTIDNFIRLKDARVTCRINDEDCEISMRWGDKIPFELSVEVPAVGNAANAAVAAARLGLKTAFRAYVGDDEYGAKCRAALEKRGVDTTLLVTQPGKHTNYHFVLWFESERTILIKHEAFDYEFADLPSPPKWLYLSSLAANSLAYEQHCEEWLEKHPETKFAFQPGTFQINAGLVAQKKLYERADLFFCNKEEARRILGSTEDDPKKLMEALRALGPKIVVLTNGRAGAYADDGSRQWFVPMYPDLRPPYERTGAGDAFASTIAAALALGEPLEKALLWGPVNAMEVVQKIGAQEGLLTREEVEGFLAKAPPEYKLAPL